MFLVEQPKQQLALVAAFCLEVTLDSLWYSDEDMANEQDELPLSEGGIRRQNLCQ